MGFIQHKWISGTNCEMWASCYAENAESSGVWFTCKHSQTNLQTCLHNSLAHIRYWLCFIDRRTHSCWETSLWPECSVSVSHISNVLPQCFGTVMVLLQMGDTGCYLTYSRTQWNVNHFCRIVLCFWMFLKSTTSWIWDQAIPTNTNIGSIGK